MNNFINQQRKAQLFLLHFAGGSNISFRFLIPFLGEFEIIPLELPGRGSRVREDLITDFDDAAKDIYQQIVNQLNGQKFMIYGHSMGAYLALRVTGMLERNHKFPHYLFVSGNAGPEIRINKRYLLNDQDFLAEIRKLGGLNADLLDDKDFMDYYLPILRSDFQLVENSNLLDESAVHAPLYAMMGDKEDNVEKISNWNKFTRFFLLYEIFDGGHFFIYEHPEKIAQLIKNCYGQGISHKRISSANVDN